MATKTKSELLLLATRLANIDLVDESAPSGAAYKLHQIHQEYLKLQEICSALQSKVSK